MIYLRYLVFAGFIFAVIVFIVSFVITESALTSCCTFGFVVDVIVAFALIVFIKAEPDFYYTEVLKSVQPVTAVTTENGVVFYNNLQDGQRYSTDCFSTVDVNSTSMKECIITRYRGIWNIVCNVEEVETVRRFEQ